MMDGSDTDIKYDQNGVCNHCLNAQIELKLCEKEKPNLNSTISLIKSSRKGDYDCLIGLSGGVDSTMALHEAIQLGLKPLVFTMDNGYNDPRADANVLQIVEKLKVPLIRYVLDLDKFRDVQSAYLKAGLINVEAVYDHLLMGATYEMCQKYGIKWVISGGNMATESIMPASWSYTARDLVNIKDIYRNQKGRELKGEYGRFPLVSLWKFNYYRWWKGIKTLYLLDYLEYHREESIKLLQKEYLYNPYGDKHCENTFTWWFQNFYLFQKFGIDKRKAHYSSLINSGQMKRREAMEALSASPIFPELGIEAKVLKYPKGRHEDYKTDEFWWNLGCKLIKFLRKYGVVRRISNNVA